MTSMNIEQWLAELKRAWEQHDIPAAVALFSNDVEYWESPHHLVPANEVNALWQDIRTCLDTKVACKVYASSGNKHAVIWQASWHDDSGETYEKAGTYLVTLNDDGKCTYFYRTSIAKESI